MKAARVHRYGPPDVIELEDIDVPVPDAGEVLVRVSAAGVGPWDALIRSGKSVLPQPLPLTLGSDLAGTVVAVGEGVDEPSVGDSVYGCTNPRFIGAYAEYAVGSARMLAKKPAHLDAVASAGLPVIAVTAWQMLELAQVSDGQTVLVHGGAGSVGSFAVQLALFHGAQVIATCHTADVDYVRELGAHDVIDADRTDFTERVRDVDAVLDTVGGTLQARSFAVLKRGGFLISSVSKPDTRVAERSGVHSNFMLVDVNRVYLKRIAELIDDGSVKVSVGTVLPLTRAREAHEMLDGIRAHGRGKIVLQTTSIAP